MNSGTKNLKHLFRGNPLCFEKIQRSGSILPQKKNEEKDGSNFWKKQTETLELKKYIKQDLKHDRRY